jgi:hypothetical protein
VSDLWYPLALRLDGGTVFLLWTSDEGVNDHVSVTEGRVVSFVDADAARQFALEQGLPLAPEEPLHLLDLDRAAEWLHEGGEPDVCVLLNVWNLARDVANSVDESFEDRGEVLDLIYDKLFFGLNLPAMTPPGERYVPEWTDEEVDLLRTTIGRAVDLIRSRVVRLADPGRGG